MKKTFLVIIPDRLSVLINKGEVVPRYYNPGNLFDEVHIMMTNDDKPEVRLVQPMVGDAKLMIHNFPPPAHFFRNTLGWQPFLMKNWIQEFLSLVSKINPNLIRTHNNFIEGFLASRAKKKLSVPFVTSLHGVWDVDDLGSIKSKIHRIFRRKLEINTLENADATICVYSEILRYAKCHGATNPHLIHNFVGGEHLKPKSSWHLSETIKLITVNRQLPEKNPSNIIRALELIPYPVDYKIIGDGVLHEHLRYLAQKLPKNKSVEFIKSLPNDQVCSLMAKSDFMVSNCHYKGISKTLIEAGLSGLPVITNRYNDGYSLQEYEDGWIHLSEDTPQGYAKSLETLIEDHELREGFGKKALHYTTQHFNPELLELKVTNIYKDLLSP